MWSQKTKVSLGFSFSIAQSARHLDSLSRMIQLSIWNPAHEFLASMCQFPPFCTLESIWCWMHDCTHYHISQESSQDISIFNRKLHRCIQHWYGSVALVKPCLERNYNIQCVSAFLVKLFQFLSPTAQHFKFLFKVSTNNAYPLFLVIALPSHPIVLHSLA